MRRHYLGMSGGAIASKLLGGLREILMARYFGTGAVSDAYRAALTATLFPIYVLTTHVVQTCFIPLYSRYRTTDPVRAAALYHTLQLFFAALGLTIAAALWLGAGPLTHALLPGFDASRQTLTVTMLRIMALGIPAYIHTALLASLGAAQKDFLIPSVRPGIQNLGMLALIVLAALLGRPALAAIGFSGTYWILALGGTLLLRRRRRIPARVPLDRALVAELARLVWRPLRPLLLTSLLLQAALLIERHIASLVGGGTVAAIDYARFVTETTYALLIVPLGLVGLSHFATLSAEQLEQQVDRVLGLLLLVLLPFSIFLVFNAEELVRLLYQRGEFDSHSSALTARALLGLAAGLWAYSASALLRSVLHARMRNNEVLCAEALAVALQISVLLLLYRSLGILALGLGPSIGALASVTFYASRFGFRFPLTGRALLPLWLAAALYAPAAVLLSRVPGGRAGLLLQIPLALLYWGSWTLGSARLRVLFRAPSSTGADPTA